MACDQDVEALTCTLEPDGLSAPGCGNPGESVAKGPARPLAVVVVIDDGFSRDHAFALAAFARRSRPEA
jgi:hypothetical protein